VRDKLRHGSPEPRQAYARLVIDEVSVSDEEIRISGSRSVLPRLRFSPWFRSGAPGKIKMSTFSRWVLVIKNPLKIAFPGFQLRGLPQANLLSSYWSSPRSLSAFAVFPSCCRAKLMIPSRRSRTSLRSIVSNLSSSAAPARLRRIAPAILPWGAAES
jgi:hypothetical protein